MSSSVSRRSVLKWTGALAAVGVVGIGLGFGADLLLRPNTTKTVTQTNTQTQTSTATATATVTQPPVTITQTTTSVPQEVLLTSSWDAGPFLAHVVNGVWTKSSPLQPNIPGAMTMFGARNRTVALDRILYPLQRVDFSTTNRNTQNRGLSQYVRITWDQAFSLVASELSRVKSTYGPSAFLMSGTGHAWPMTVNSGAKWQAILFGLLGGATTMVGDTSTTGSSPSTNMTLGSTTVSTTTNNSYDVLANSKLVIFWSNDPSWKSYTTLVQNNIFMQWKAAGIKMIVVDAFMHNDTAALFADQYIAPLPGTDEALLAAIANVWITNGTYNKSFVSTHVYGFTQFSNYIMGVSDGIPKTPAWASAICGVSATVITNLANEWSSQPTFLYGYGTEGAERRDFACQHSRMELALCALQGIGIPGQGLGAPAATVTSVNPGTIGALPTVTNPVTQIIRHNNLAQAILTGSATWTTAERHNYVCAQESYPLTGNSQIHLIAWGSGSGSSAGINQRQNLNTKIQAIQSSNIEFTFSCNAWWESTAKFSDVILPVATVGEVDDMTTWQNYLVYQHTLQAPPGEAMSDLDVYTGIIEQLGLGPQLTTLLGGKTTMQLLESVYPASAIPMTFQQFQQAGYYEYALSTAPVVTATWANFYASPTKYPFATTSGLIEIYSQAIAAFYGANTPNAPPIPMYIAGPENLLNATSTYPLLLSSGHAKFARHSQWQNLAWLRDEPQMFTSGYKTMLINPADATAYGLKKGDVVRVFNARGQILAGAYPSDECAPKTVWVSEGGWYAPQQPGVVNSIDLGGNAENLIDGRQPEPLCDGMINSALVQIEKFTGVTGTAPVSTTTTS